MAEKIPKAVQVTNAANILEITFDNGQKRYLKSHYIDNYVDAWHRGEQGKGKRRNLILRPTAMWEGSNPRILADGTIVLFDDDRYTPAELWENSAADVNHLNQVKKIKPGQPD